MIESTQSDRLNRHLGNSIFKTVLGYILGDQIGSFNEKKTEVENLMVGGQSIPQKIYKGYISFSNFIELTLF